MIALLGTSLMLVVGTGLATFVATRAWDHPPSRLFVLKVASLVVLSIFSLIRSEITDPVLAYSIVAIIDLTMGVLLIATILLVSRLFMPQWWSGTRPIRWIALPYVLITFLLFIDLVARTGWFVEGVSLDQGIYRSQLAVPGGIIMLTLMTVGWVVVLVILVAAMFTGQRQVRIVAAMLAGTMLFTMIGGIVMLFFPLLGQLSNILLDIPILGALTYAVLRTRLLTPTRAALDLALQAMNEAVIVLDLDTNILYTNPPARALGIERNRLLRDVLASCGTSDEERNALDTSIAIEVSTVAHPLTIEGRRITFSHTPVRDKRGTVVGILLLGHDVTEIEQHTNQLAQERAQLEMTVQQLKQEQQHRDQLAATVRALSMPVIPVLDGVLVLPLIGDFDRERIEEFMTVLLTSIERERAHLVLIDITGLPSLDTDGAAGLLQSVQAASLLGTRCVLVGVRPEIAKSLVALGISLDGLESAATLQQVLPSAIKAERPRAMSNSPTFRNNIPVRGGV